MMKLRKLRTLSLRSVVLAGSLLATIGLVGATGGNISSLANHLALLKTQDQTPTDGTQNVDTHYVLGPEDVLYVIVQNVPEDSGDYLVRPDGKISFPIVGDVVCAGQTVSQVEDALRTGLAKELRNPQVSVNLKQMRMNRIYIDGSVRNPFSYDFKKGWRLSELISVAGGLTDQPQRLTAIVYDPTAPTQTVPLRKIFDEADDASDLALKPGDSVYIRAEPTMHVNVVGQVQRSGPIDIYEGQGAVEALGGAQGATPEAALSKAKIIRNGKEIPVDLYDAVVNGDSTKNVAMQPNDTLVIPLQYQEISVVGTVAKPGPLILPDSRPLTLSQAISEAGGLAPRAKQTAVLTTTGADGKLISKDYDLKTLGTPKNPDPKLSDKDVVFVPQSGATNVGDLLNVGQFYYIVRSILRGN